MCPPLLRYCLLCLLMALLPLRGFAAVALANCIPAHTAAQTLPTHAEHPAGHMHATGSPGVSHATPACSHAAACCAAVALIAAPLFPMGTAPHLAIQVTNPVAPTSVPGTPLERPPRA